jgi:hypothetical protein
VKCPYCTDDIPDQASVCRSCLRDLSFFIPIRNALSNTEKTLQQLCDDVEKVRITPASTQAMAITLFLVGSPALSSCLYWMSWQWWATSDFLFGSRWMTGEWLVALFALAAPFPASLWLGAFSARLTARLYVSFGLAVGAAAFALHLLIYSAHTGNLLPEDWFSSLLCYLAAGALLSFAGATLGEKVRSRGLHGQRYLPVNQKPTTLQAILRSPMFVYAQLLVALLGPVVKQWMTRQ